MTRIAALCALAAAAAQAGCYLPVASCEERVVAHVLGAQEIELHSDGSFTTAGQSYASCKDYCAAHLQGVREVQSCTTPTYQSASGTGAGSWSIRCTADEIACTNPTIVELPSGRRYDGLPSSPALPTTVAAWFCELARLEAASIAAFDRLARELRAHGAPRSLVRRARAAKKDEARHTKMAIALARCFGGRPVLETPGPLETRPLEEVAHENAVEGCVRETLGASLAMFQASEAIHPRIRTAMRTIARDEATHAELAWSVHAWSLQRLDPRARARVAESLAKAARGLDARAMAGTSRELCAVAGLPGQTQSEAMIASLRASLFEPVGGDDHGRAGLRGAMRARLALEIDPPPSRSGHRRPQSQPRAVA